MGLLELLKWFLRKGLNCGIRTVNLYFYVTRKLRRLFPMNSTDRSKETVGLDLNYQQGENFTRSLQCRLETLDGDEISWSNEQNGTNENFKNPGYEDLIALDDIHNGHDFHFDNLKTLENNQEFLKHATEYVLPSFEDLALLDTPEMDKKFMDEFMSEFHTKNDSSSRSEISDCEDDQHTSALRVRRCSSLKTGKTPPGTPSRKKIVRFADVLGLDLADVRTYLDEIPKVPNSAYNDLKTDCDTSESPVINPRTLLALFQQPCTCSNFLEKVATNMVMLENAYLDDPIAFCIKGVVRVRNLDFNKSVHIRFTLNSWETTTDIEARYVENSSDGFTDKFSFIIYAYTLNIGQKLEFAVRFQCKGEQFWDSNSGSNYRFQCLPSSNPKLCDTFTDDFNAQLASFYYLDDVQRDNVQDYIVQSLEKNAAHRVRTISNRELVTFFVFLFFSVLVLYVRKLLVF